MSIELRGELITPQAVREKVRLPRTDILTGSRQPFELAHTHQWEFVEGEHARRNGEWLPAYTEVRKEPGGNGVVERGNGPTARIDATAATLGMMRKGAVTIRLGDPRMGDYANYLARHELRGGGYFYCFAGVKVSVSANGTRAIPRPGKAWVIGLQRQMLKSGLIDPMSREALDEHLLVLGNRLQRWSELMSTGRLTKDAHDAKATETEDLMRRMREAFDVQFGGLEERAPVDAIVSEPELLHDDDQAFEPSELAEPEPPAPTKRGR